MAYEDRSYASSYSHGRTPRIHVHRRDTSFVDPRQPTRIPARALPPNLYQLGPETTERIFRELQSHHWALHIASYLTMHNGVEKMINEGEIFSPQSLKKGGEYFLLPSMSDPSLGEADLYSLTSEEVKSALECLISKLGGKLPTIRFRKGLTNQSGTTIISYSSPETPFLYLKLDKNSVTVSGKNPWDLCPETSRPQTSIPYKMLMDYSLKTLVDAFNPQIPDIQSEEPKKSQEPEQRTPSRRVSGIDKLPNFA